MALELDRQLPAQLPVLGSNKHYPPSHWIVSVQVADFSLRGCSSDWTHSGEAGPFQLPSLLILSPLLLPFSSSSFYLTHSELFICSHSSSGTPPPPSLPGLESPPGLLPQRFRDLDLEWLKFHSSKPKSKLHLADRNSSLFWGPFPRLTACSTDLGPLPLSVTTFFKGPT